MATGDGDEDSLLSLQPFTSIHIRTNRQLAVAEAWQTIPAHVRSGNAGSTYTHGALISPPENGWVTVYDKACDLAYGGYIVRIMEHLARQVQRPAIALRLHTEDTSFYWLVDSDGALVDTYCNDPDRTWARATKEFRDGFRGKPELLATMAHRDSGVESLRMILWSPYDDELFRMMTLGEALGLTGPVVGYSYAVFSEKEYSPWLHLQG